MLHGTWDLSFLTRDQTPDPCIARRILCLQLQFWPRWVVLAVHRRSLAAASGGCSWLWPTGLWLRCFSFAEHGCLGLSGCNSQAPAHGLRSCGTQARLPCGTRGLPGLRMGLHAPCIGRRLLTLEQQGSPLLSC